MVYGQLSQLNGEKEQLKAQHNLSEISLLSCLHFTTTLIMMLSSTWIFMNHEFIMVTIMDIFHKLLHEFYCYLDFRDRFLNHLDIYKMKIEVTQAPLCAIK